MVYVLTFFPVEEGGVREAAVALRIFHDDAAPRQTKDDDEESESRFAVAKAFFAEFDSVQPATGAMRWRDATAAIGNHVDPQHSQRLHFHLVDFALSFAPAVAEGALPGWASGEEEEGFLPPRVAVFNRPISLHEDGMTYRHLPMMAVTRPPYASDKEDEDDMALYFYSGLFRVVSPEVAERPRYERACQGFQSVVCRFNADRPIEGGRPAEAAETPVPCGRVEKFERMEPIEPVAPSTSGCAACLILVSDSAAILMVWWREVLLPVQDVYLLGAVMLMHVVAICICR